MLNHKSTRSARLFWLGALLGAAVFLLVYGLAPLDIANDAFCRGGYIEKDIQQHYAGWLFYRSSALGWPLGVTQAVNAPQGVSVAYTDSIPLLAVLCRPLAAALGGQGLLVSNEFVAARAEVLRSNLERMGVPNAVVLNEDTGRIAAALPEFFDRVLVDAPCSGEGMFRKEAAATAQHNDGLVAHCAELGAEILENAAALLAPGGVLVYSTCTFAPDEDEGQIANFLAKHPEFTLCDLSACGFGRPGEGNLF
mgnify:CR=1 FL=1